MEAVMRHRRVIIISLVGVAALLGVLWLRFLVIDSARAHLETLGLSEFHLVGIRIPCVGTIDFGVYVAYIEGGIEKPGKLCRKLGWQSGWRWHPVRD